MKVDHLSYIKWVKAFPRFVSILPPFACLAIQQGITFLDKNYDFCTPNSHLMASAKKIKKYTAEVLILSHSEFLKAPVTSVSFLIPTGSLPAFWQSWCRLQSKISQQTFILLYLNHQKIKGLHSKLPSFHSPKVKKIFSYGQYWTITPMQQI